MKYLLFSISVLIISCTGSKKASQEISKVLQSQSTAWNKGDIPAFMDGYWASDSLTFVGGNGVTYGWQPVLDRYLVSYPNQDRMGKLKFEVIRAKPMGRKNYLVIGKYTLKRKSDQPSGYFTLVWEKIDGNWKIISDQTN